MANVATVAASSGITAERSPPMWSYAYLQSQSLMPRSKYISSKMQGPVIHWGGWQGPKVSRCTMVLAVLKRMANFTQSYAKFE